MLARGGVRVYSVLIVDDEQWIRKGIIAKIRNYGFHFSRIEEASDGSEALEKIQANRPDIAFIDIKMEGMDGLELMRRSNRLSRDIRFIVITGYAEFDFAEKAINSGARGYLLKPIDGADFVRMVQRMIIELDQESSDSHSEYSPVPAIDTDRSIRLLLQPRNLEMANADEDHSSGLSASSGWFALGIIHIDGSNYRKRLKCAQANTTLKRIIRVRIEKSVSASDAHLLDPDIDSPDLYFLVSNSKREEVRSALKQLSLVILTKVKALGYSVTIGTSDIRTEISRDLYLQSKQVLTSRLLHGEGRIYRYEDVEAAGKVTAASGDCVLLEGYIRRGSLSEAEAEIARMLIPAEGNPATVDNLRLSYFSVLHAIVTSLVEIGVSSMALDEMVFSERIFGYFDNVTEIAAFLSRTLRSAFERAGKSGVGDHSDGIVRDIKSYIDQHYPEHISTQTLADRFGLHPNYLSSLFRQKTDITVTSYIHEVRINAACRILLPKLSDSDS